MSNRINSLRVLSQSNEEYTSWKDLFDPKSTFKLLYSLEIVDSIIFPLEETMNIRKKEINKKIIKKDKTREN
jgi:hypothetical protein